MKRIVLWSLVSAGVLFVFTVLLVGSNRLCGLRGATVCNGTVMAIQPKGRSNSVMPKGRLVKLRLDGERICLFPSSDPQWTLVRPGDRVQARLFPSPFWAMENGPWQDGTLLIKSRPEPVKVAKKISKRKFSRLSDAIGLGLAVAFMGAVIYTERTRRRDTVQTDQSD